jgi:hypothetical protein
MDPKKLPASLVAALSLAAQGCIATTCLSVLKDDTATSHTGDTATGPCLQPIYDHTGDTAVGPCLSPERHTAESSGTGATSTTGGTGATGGSGATTAIDTDAVLDRLPPDVRQRLGRP